MKKNKKLELRKAELLFFFFSLPFLLSFSSSFILGLETTGLLGYFFGLHKQVSAFYFSVILLSFTSFLKALTEHSGEVSLWPNMGWWFGRRRCSKFCQCAGASVAGRGAPVEIQRRRNLGDLRQTKLARLAYGRFAVATGGAPGLGVRVEDGSAGDLAVGE